MDAPLCILTSTSTMDAPFWHFNIHLKFYGALSALEEYINYDSEKEHDEDTSNSSFSCWGVPSGGRVLCRGVQGVAIHGLKLTTKRND